MHHVSRPELLLDISEYYSKKLIEHGTTPQGVDWNAEGGQVQRFKQLLKVVSGGETFFSINDLGCGYGALVDYLSSFYLNFKYAGYDISEEMIEAAKERYYKKYGYQFFVSANPTHNADYGVASGIFNVKLNRPDAEWLFYICETLRQLNSSSMRGFSFNCLTLYSDSDKKKSYLYYADPCFLFDFCKQNFSRNVALFHDYDLYEFTIVVRK